MTNYTGYWLRELRRALPMRHYGASAVERRMRHKWARLCARQYAAWCEK